MADYSTPSAPVVDPADATPGARPWGPNGEPVNEPVAGDDQRRCWNLLIDNASGLGSQCVVFNGHLGGHQHDLGPSTVAVDRLRNALIRYARGRARLVIPMVRVSEIAAGIAVEYDTGGDMAPSSIGGGA